FIDALSLSSQNISDATHIFCSLVRLPLCSTLFPYTTLFRSIVSRFVQELLRGFEVFPFPLLFHSHNGLSRLHYIDHLYHSQAGFPESLQPFQWSLHLSYGLRHPDTQRQATDSR